MSADPAAEPDFGRRGLLVVLSSPSGAGKSTISRLLLEDPCAGLSLSVSVTTRPRRASEVEGVHYRFVGERDFVRMRDRGELLEWAEVHGNLYGTPRDPVERALETGRDVLFDIDWQGTRQIKEAAGDDVVSIFILPPSGAELKARLERRAEDDAGIIQKRLANARAELRQYTAYDYVVVNDQLQEALAGVRAILEAERLKRWRTTGLDGFIEGLVEAL